MLDSKLSTNDWDWAVDIGEFVNLFFPNLLYHLLLELQTQASVL